MSSPVSLFDANGIEVFRGTQSPGGGSMPGAARWIGPFPVNLLQYQTVDLNGFFTGGPPDAGHFTLNYDGADSSVIQFDASAAAVEAALQAIPALAGKVTVLAAADSGTYNIVLDASVASPVLFTATNNTLTKAAAPVTPDIYISNVNALAFPLVDLAAGDIIEDWTRVVDTPISGSPIPANDAALILGDMVPDGPVEALVAGVPTLAPSWYSPSSNPINVAQANAFTNFGGNATTGDSSNSNSAALSNVGEGSPFNLPAPVLNDVTLRIFSVNPGGHDCTQGAFRVWITTATPAAP